MDSRQLQRFKRYPVSAQSRKEEGVVLLSFSLDRSGHVLAHSKTGIMLKPTLH